MPKYVDHVERRRQLAGTAATLVATHGLDALSFRRVADAAGYSPTVVTHYFSDKRDLLLSTYREVARRAGLRFDEARERGGGLRECLESLLPLDDERQTEWRLLTCYWSAAVSDAELAEEEATHVRSAQQRVQTLLRDTDPSLAEAKAEVLARRLLSLVHGLAAHSALDPHHWSPEQQRRVLADELGALDVGDRAG